MPTQCTSLKACRGEVHNMLSLMRRKRIGSSKARFHSEIPLSEESDIYRQFKIVQETLQHASDLKNIDTLTYLRPFLFGIRDGDSAIAGASLAAVNKFLLYDIINLNSKGSCKAVNAIAWSLAVDRKTGSLPLAATVSAVETLKMLELMVHCVRSDCGRMLGDESVWVLFETCFLIRQHWASVELLRHAAENTVAHLVLTVFSRISDSIKAVASKNVTTSTTTTTTTTTNMNPYGEIVALRVLRHIVSLMEPRIHGIDTRALALSLVNIILETGGEAVANVTDLVEIMRGDLCKWLLLNSQTEEVLIVSLTLRVVYNLFNSIKKHMKIQLEVFFISVHLRIANSITASPELKELALESLLDFCQEPTLMHDLFINYDCDIHFTNLFEDLCKSLCNNIRPSKSGKICTLQLLAMEGLIAIIGTMSRRCELLSPLRRGSRSSSHGSKDDDEESETLLGTGMTPQEFQQRKHHKQKLAMFVSKFNKKPKHLLVYASELGLLSKESTPLDVAKFLFDPPQGLSKEALGEYLSLPPDRHKFCHEVLLAYVQMFDFEKCTFDGALRIFLSAFRLPGESQKIERLMEAVAEQIYRQVRGPLKSSDAAFVLAFSVIMLHTDHHNPSVERKMQKEDFILNLETVNDGENFPEGYLSTLYDSVTTSEFEVQPSNASEEREAMNHMAPEQWDRLVLERVRSVDKSSFAHDTYLHHSRRAGVHEMEMFLVIAKDAMDALFQVFEIASTDLVVRKTADAMTDFARIACYFNRHDLFNEIIVRIAKMYIKLSSDLFDLVATGSLDNVTTGGENTNLNKNIINTETRRAAVSQHRALLALQHMFRMISEFKDHVRESWRNVLACLSTMLDFDVLPDELVPRDASKKLLDARKEAQRHATKASLGGGGGFLTDFLTSLIEETEEDHHVMLGHSSEETKSMHELGALRALICQLEIPDLFEALEDVHSDSLISLLSHLTSVASVSIENMKVSKTSSKHGLGRGSDPRMCIVCVEILSLVCARNVKRIRLVWPYFKAVYERLLNSAEGIDLDISMITSEDSTRKDENDDDDETSKTNHNRKATVPEISMQRQNSPYFSRARVSSAGTDDGVTNSNFDVHYVEDEALSHATKCLIRTCTIVIQGLSKEKQDEEIDFNWLVSALGLIETLPEHIMCKSSHLILNGIRDMFRAQEMTKMFTILVWSAEMSVLARLATLEKTTRNSIWEIMERFLAKDRLDEFNVDDVVRLADEMGSLELSVRDDVDGTEARLRHIQFLQTLLQTLSKCPEASVSKKKRDLVWLNVMQSFKSFLLSNNDKIRRRASSCLHTALLAPSWIVSPSTWKLCFENVLFPLAHEVHETGTDSMRVRTTTLLARTCLHNISSFAEHSEFHKLWFRIIGVLAKDIQGGSEILVEAVLEAFKNIMVVMISTGTFDRVSEKSGQDVLTMTWAFVSTVSPTLRSEIEKMLSCTTTMNTNKEEEEKNEENTTLTSKTKVVVGSLNEEEEEQGSGVVMSL